MWEQIKTKAVELLKKWWWAILGFIGNLPADRQAPEVGAQQDAEIKQREKRSRRLKEKAEHRADLAGGEKEAC